MKCSICGQEAGTLIGASIYLQNGYCSGCQRQAKLIRDWASRVYDIVQPYDSADGLYHLVYKDAFGDVLFDKGYKRAGNRRRALCKHVSRIMDTIIE